MAEYIDRDKTIAEIDDCFPANPTSEFSKGVAVGLAMAKVAVNHTPTADVRPVRRGKWIDMGDFISCSSCNATRLKEFESDYGKVVRLDARANFCPNCGADMREES